MRIGIVGAGGVEIARKHALMRRSEGVRPRKSFRVPVLLDFVVEGPGLGVGPELEVDSERDARFDLFVCGGRDRLGNV